MPHPTPKQIKELRLRLGLNQTEAATLINMALRTWQQWEQGVRKMRLSLWELFCLKTGTFPPKGSLRATFKDGNIHNHSLDNVQIVAKNEER